MKLHMRLMIEVRAIIDKAYATAKEILIENKDKLHTMAAALLKYETLNFDQINDIMNDKEPKPPEGWDVPDTHNNIHPDNTSVSTTEDSSLTADDAAEKPVK